MGKWYFVSLGGISRIEGDNYLSFMGNLSETLGGSFLWGITQAWLSLAALGFVVSWTLTPRLTWSGGLVHWSISAFFYLAGALVVAVSFVAGYAWSETDPGMTTIIPSQLIATSSFVVLVAFPSAILPYLPPPVRADALEKLSEGLIVIYSISSFLLAIIGNLLGRWTSEKHARPIIRRRTVVLALLLLFCVSSALPVQAKIMGLEKTLDLQVPVTVVNFKYVDWDAGVENIAANFGPVPKGSGLLSVCWSGNLTFYVVILGSLVETPPTLLSCQYIPFASPDDSAIFNAWFHNDLCSSTTGCPAGYVYYRITIFY